MSRTDNPKQSTVSDFTKSVINVKIDKAKVLEKVKDAKESKIEKSWETKKQPKLFEGE